MAELRPQLKPATPPKPALAGWPIFLAITTAVVVVLPPGTEAVGWQSRFIHSFIGLVLEALPFLLLGGLMAGIIEVCLPDHWLPSLGRRFGKAGLPLVAGLSPMLPLCECGVVGVGRGLLRKGLPLAHTAVYLLAAPILNPIVLLTAWLAFSSHPDAGQYVVLRAAGGVIVPVVIGLLLWRVRPEQILVPNFANVSCGHDHHDHGHDHAHDHDHDHDHDHAHDHDHEHAHGDHDHDHAHDHGDHDHDHEHNHDGLSDCGHDHGPVKKGFMNKLLRIFDTSRLEFTDMATWFVVGIAIAAGLKTAVGTDVIGDLAADPILGAPVMMAAAFLLSLCSEVDAFIAAAFPEASVAAVTAFLVFGPMIDIRLLLLYRSVVKTRFVFAFAGIITVTNLMYAWALAVIL